MNCLYCNDSLIWQNDFSCEDIYFCSCEEGIITFYECSNCSAEYQITLNCKGD